MITSRFRLLCSFVLFVAAACVAPAAGDPLAWPAATAETKPWSRWWWFGNITDEKSITAELEHCARAGLGGLELTPVYGVRGEENRFLRYLSPKWMQAFEHVLTEARRLGLGIDLANGSGWPFGGPWLGDVDVAHYLAHRVYTVAPGERLVSAITLVQPSLIRYAGPTRTPLAALRQPITANANLQELAIDQVRFAQPLPLVAVIGYPAQGEPLELTKQVNARGELDWTAPSGSGTWTLYALFQGPHGKMVERAGPGGEGPALDHFSSAALKHYLAKFDDAFAGRSLAGLRAFFNDSYEVDDSEGAADFTPHFFDEFARRRGYDLRTQLPALFDPADTRVISDYRETISDLMLDEFTRPWREWAHQHGALTRNQAHGSPANVLDLYAASDIPEQEANGFAAIKLASSAAHLTGKRLTSSETGTWLNEHFLSTLAELKAETDQFFLGGVNHQCYHGTAFSPLDEPWPGHQFYAAVELNPRNPFWEDSAAVNAYVTRVQSFLQTGEPDEEVLLYFNIHDRWAQRGDGRLPHFGHGRDPLGTNIGETAAALRQAGVGFDYVSDRLLHERGVTRYRAIVVPPTMHLPRTTLARLVELAEGGMCVWFAQQLPSSEPGLLAAKTGGDGSPSGPLLDSKSHQAGAAQNGRLGEASLPSRQDFSDLLRTIRELQVTEDGTAISHLGRGEILVADTLAELLAHAPSIRRETMTMLGLEYVRRKVDGTPLYFIVNRGRERVERWVPLRATANAAALFDPMTGRSGVAAHRAFGPGSPGGAVFLQLEPGESVIVRTFHHAIAGAPWAYWSASGKARELEGEWTLEFVQGRPELPAPRKAKRLVSWTDLGGGDVKAFSGTARYSITFQRPDESAAAWSLDFGGIADSARVVLNGQPLGTLVQPPWKIVLDPAIWQPTNTLEVFVTNLAANRIADLDRRGVPWKKFYNTNFPAHQRANTGPDGLFYAGRWAPRTSGLLGPVTLQPLKPFDPAARE